MSAVEKHTFQAETQQLLDIVIHSLYTDREVFVRELISNAADACERLRFLQAASQTAVFEPDRALTITLKTDEQAHTLTIADTGIGMTHAELVENLGTIAHSGTRSFLTQLAESQKPNTDLIGQFGVGFYSAFMVAKQVTVLSRSHQPEETGWRWASDGAGGYELEPASDLPRGTQVIVELKEDARSFAKPPEVESIIKRYSNLVQFPIELNGQRVNTVQAIWARGKSEVTEQDYNEFYRLVSHDHEDPLCRLHFTADAPLSIQALLFVPARNLEQLTMIRTESEVHLYCRRVLIEARAKDLLPSWLRFLRGVVDSEDLPLNVSRERMQDSQLLKKIGQVITGRWLKSVEELAEKNPDQFARLHDEYQRCLLEGALSDYEHRETLGKLLRFESSATEKGRKTSLAEYVQRMPGDQSQVFYLLAPNREVGESSPYYEVFRARKWEVLWVDDILGELALSSLAVFNGKPLSAAQDASVEVAEWPADQPSLSDEAAKGLADWLKSVFGDRVGEVRVSRRLVQSPALALEPGKHPMQTMLKAMRLAGREGEAGPPVPPHFEINAHHSMIVRLDQMRLRDAALAGKVGEHLLDSALMSAGLLDDPRPMLKRLDELLEQMLASKSA